MYYRCYKLKQAMRQGKIAKQLTFGELVDVAAEAYVVNSDERDALLDYNEKRKLAIAVDEYTFDMELLTGLETEEPILKSA